MKVKSYKLTAEGIEELDCKICQLKNDLSKISERIVELTQGENEIQSHEYRTLIEERMLIKQEIEKLEEVKKNVESVDNSDNSKVGVGHSVKLENHRLCYMIKIVEAMEANPSTGRVSKKSPLGQSVYGKKLGQTIEVRTPLGVTEFNIVEIQ